jgi:hypothetical protein
VVDAAKHRDVASARAEGVTWVCAMCEGFWWGRERGLPYCEATARGEACCGPWGGGTYPQYAGPLQGHLGGYCFLCGAASDALVLVGDQPGGVGVCSAHEALVGQYEPKGSAGRPGNALRPPVAVRR